MLLEILTLLRSDDVMDQEIRAGVLEFLAQHFSILVDQLSVAQMTRETRIQLLATMLRPKKRQSIFGEEIVTAYYLLRELYGDMNPPASWVIRNDGVEVFSERMMPSPDSVEGAEYRGFEALSRCDALWETSNNVLLLFGLPEERAIYANWMLGLTVKTHVGAEAKPELPELSRDQKERILAWIEARQSG